ncbi:MAG TPA: hypothetical protein VGM37_13195 [Armatimonadota bacterium]|jgi:hypothetical protein
MSLPVRFVLGALLGAGALLVPASPASAHKRDFVFSYDWWTPAKGEKEIETWGSYATADKSTQGQIEYETGLTERLALSAYLVTEKAKGESAHAGYKAEARYRFGDYAEGKILPAGYIELEKMQTETAELEGKLILSRFVGDANLTLNLIASGHMRGETNREYSYALGYARGTRNPSVRLGMEAVGSLQDNSHGVGPVVAYDINASTRAVLGSAFGLTTGTGTQIRFIVEYEWF